MFALLAAVLDGVSIVLFAALGRETHAAGVNLGDVLSVAWPFLLAAAIAWLLTRAWRTPDTIWPTGVVIWLVTTAGGLALRGLSGGGLAPTFQLVALSFLALTLLGHRLVLAAAAKALVARTRRREMN